ncbi:hypothetical protein [Oceanobacillus bengalensis]|uniref:Uncharacterized protein n=1 Tax=Oceanobacillus bengalensis TaxID=1435466 RepID=A0A494YUK2_9BACI|nr:hypothetical protein [Oceanobacillus bengalensis]RKQ13822.1 hypothetical protein D8M05_15055 [Oceanobacillus bengalensis]
MDEQNSGIGMLRDIVGVVREKKEESREFVRIVREKKEELRDFVEFTRELTGLSWKNTNLEDVSICLMFTRKLE